MSILLLSRSDHIFDEKCLIKLAQCCNTATLNEEKFSCKIRTGHRSINHFLGPCPHPYNRQCRKILQTCVTFTSFYSIHSAKYMNMYSSYFGNYMHNISIPVSISSSYIIWYLFYMATQHALGHQMWDESLDI